MYLKAVSCNNSLVITAVWNFFNNGVPVEI